MFTYRSVSLFDRSEREYGGTEAGAARHAARARAGTRPRAYSAAQRGVGEEQESRLSHYIVDERWFSQRGL